MHVVELAFAPTRERLAARPAHRERLARLHTEGALLVFTLARTELDQALEADPCYRTPGVGIRSIREWNPVVGTG